MQRIKKIYFPIILLWRDKTIDVDGCDRLIISAIYVRKGRTLTFSGMDPTKRMTIEFGPLSIIKGDVRAAKKAKEISVEDLRKLQEENNQ